VRLALDDLTSECVNERAVGRSSTTDSRFHALHLRPEVVPMGSARSCRFDTPCQRCTGAIISKGAGVTRGGLRYR
jgi:hypothetical protein